MSKKVDYTPASELVRAAARRSGRNGATVYNDRLKTGGRSIKADGRGRQFYMPIKRELEKMGYAVKLVNIGLSRHTIRNENHYRIHVV